jgi:hypothetical protein
MAARHTNLERKKKKKILSKGNKVSPLIYLLSVIQYSTMWYWAHSYVSLSKCPHNVQFTGLGGFSIQKGSMSLSHWEHITPEAVITNKNNIL